MTPATLPYNPQDGDPEDISQIMADFAAILAVLNGDIRSDNISPSAAIPYSKLSLAGGILNSDIAAAAAIAVSKLAAGSTGSVLKTSSGSVPTWVKGSAGAMLYQTSTDQVFTNAPTNGQELRSVGTVPTWVTVPSVRVVRVISQSIPDATDTVITFDTERWDTDTMHDLVSNTSRITCKTAGKYLVGAQITWNANNTGARQAWLRLNATDDYAKEKEFAPSNTLQTDLNVTTLLDLAVNDFVEVFVRQTSGGSLNVANTPQYGPEFWAVRLG